MLSNFSYLVPEFLAGCAMPGVTAPLPEDLAEASADGITAVVSLTERPLGRAVIEEAGLRYLHLPVQDMTAPSLDQMKEFVQFVEEEKARGGRVLVHCMAGYGRTGTMLAAWLIKQGMTVPQAVGEVRTTRPGSIETATQVAALQRFSSHLASK